MGSFALDVRCAFRGLLRSRPRTVGILSTLYGSGRLARTVTKRSFQFLTTDRGTNFLRIFGRLRSGRTVAQVRDEWGRIARELREAYPGTNAKKTEPRVLPLKEEMLGTQRPALVLLMGAVLSVWLLACTNILNLQLIRLLAHERESAIRCAIGASAMEVTRPYLIENIALICAGGGLGAAVAASPCGSRCGVYTVVSAAAREQRRQLAIRLALGASPSAMVRAVLALTGGLLARYWRAAWAGTGGSRAPVRADRSRRGFERLVGVRACVRGDFLWPQLRRVICALVVCWSSIRLSR
jgi:hypothetical protein